MDSGTKLLGTVDAGPKAPADPDDPFRIWREIQESSGAPQNDLVGTRVAPAGSRLAPRSSDLRALADLDDPRLVLSEAYIGIDRRRPGTTRTLARLVHFRRRSLLRLDVLIVLAVAVLVVTAGLLLVTAPHPAPRVAVSVAVPER